MDGRNGEGRLEAGRLVRRPFIISASKGGGRGAPGDMQGFRVFSMNLTGLSA